VTLIKLDDRVVVGPVALEEVFERFRERRRQPESALSEELLAAVKVFNYVPAASENRYRTALLRAYISYCDARP
jgi:hypothetical protein